MGENPYRNTPVGGERVKTLLIAPPISKTLLGIGVHRLPPLAGQVVKTTVKIKQIGYAHVQGVNSGSIPPHSCNPTD